MSVKAAYLSLVLKMGAGTPGGAEPASSRPAPAPPPAPAPHTAGDLIGEEVLQKKAGDVEEESSDESV